MEKYILSFINSSRHEHSLHGVFPHFDLGEAARKHCVYIQNTGSVGPSGQFSESDELVLHHRFETDNTWMELKGMFDRLTETSPYREKILSPSYTHVGIGAVMGNGEAWVTLRFVKI